MRYFFIMIPLFAACTVHIDAEKDSAVDSGDPGDSVDSGDSGGSSQQNLPNILTVHIDGPEQYGGYQVFSPRVGQVGMTDYSAPGAYSWEVDATDIPRMITLQTDGADVTYDGATDVVTYAPPDAAMTEGFVCAGDFADSTVAPNGGKLACFFESQWVTGAVLTDADAALIAFGDTANLYAGDADVQVGDVNGDGFNDLTLGGSGTMAVLSGIWHDVAATNLSLLPVVKNVPGDADQVMTICDINGDGVTDGSLYCQPKAIGDGWLMVTDESNTVTGNRIEAYTLPLDGSPPANSFTGSSTTGPFGSRVVWSPYGWIVNDPYMDQFVVYSADLSTSSTVWMPEWAEAWGADVSDDGHWLALGAGLYENELGVTSGAIYVFDISSGMPATFEDAQYVGIPTDGNEGCGYSLKFARDNNGELVLAAGCYTSVGANHHGMVVYAIPGSP